MEENSSLTPFCCPSLALSGNFIWRRKFFPKEKFLLNLLHKRVPDLAIFLIICLLFQLSRFGTWMFKNALPSVSYQHPEIDLPKIDLLKIVSTSKHQIRENWDRVIPKIDLLKIVCLFKCKIRPNLGHSETKNSKSSKFTQISPVDSLKSYNFNVAFVFSKTLRK